MEHLPYNDYGSAMRRKLGGRVQKLAIDAGLSCPNRDGTIGFGGCTFCLGEAFSPAYCREATSITEQIERALRFHSARNRRADSYLAYFQSNTNTHADIVHLERLYNEALSHPAISGIIIGTRPDCITFEILQLLEYIAQSKYVAVEYGIESVYDTTLAHVNRGHDFATAISAVAQTKAAGIDVGAHFILGLPNERATDIFNGIAHINRLGIDFVKFHQLQIYRNTAMEREWSEHPERFLFGTQSSTEEYADLLVEIIRRLDPHIAIERLASQAPRNLIAHSPLNGIRPHELRDMVVNRMVAENLRQGDLYTFAQ
jgi:radical SAM protein (TIGR01212 family)